MYNLLKKINKQSIQDLSDKLTATFGFHVTLELALEWVGPSRSSHKMCSSFSRPKYKIENFSYKKTME